MNTQFSTVSESFEEEYQDIMDDIINEEYQDYGSGDVTEMLETATEHLSEEEAEEFWGIAAGIATSLASKTIRKVAPKLIKGAVSKFRGWRKKRRPKRNRRKRILNRSRKSARKALPKLLRNRNFMKSILGMYMNTTTGHPIGKTLTRLILRGRQKREVNEVSFEAYMNALSHLAKKAAGDSEVISGNTENSYMTDENGKFICNPLDAEERAETLLAKLFEDEESYSEYDEFDENEDLEFYEEEEEEYEAFSNASY